MRFQPTCHPDRPGKGRGLCAQCYNAAWYAENAERRKAVGMAWDREHRAARRAISAGWRRRYPDRQRAATASWAARHPGAWKERHARLRAAEPDRVLESYRIKSATRKARKLAAFVERVEPSVVWDRDGGICHICKRPADSKRWDLEHVIPLVKGGEHSYANTAVSHPSCNYRKRDRRAS